eukprot:scaffold144059_cov21-Prasinocladus_malaysianus.AAC.1
MHRLVCDAMSVCLVPHMCHDVDHLVQAPKRNSLGPASHTTAPSPQLRPTRQTYTTASNNCPGITAPPFQRSTRLYRAVGIVARSEEPFR